MPKQRHEDAYINSVEPPRYSSVSYYFNNLAEVKEGLHDKTAPLGRYGRYNNPTWEMVERRLSDLVMAEKALIFASGMAAHFTTFITFLKAGDHVVLPSESYRQVRNVFLKILPKLGVIVHEFSIRNPDEFIANIARIKDKITLVHLEMPSSPHMYLIDVARVRETVGPDVIITMDSSFSPPPNFDALKWGVDLTIISGTKYLNGHGDIMCGVVAGRKDLVEQITWHRDTTGGIADGNVAYLLNRSLHTLRLRMDHLNKAGLEVARFLESHPAVAGVLYNGLESHPHHHLARKYLNGYGGVVTFETGLNEQDTARFVDNLKLPYMASNFGAPQTLIEQSSYFTYFEYTPEELKRIGVTYGTLRFALGYIDSTEEIIADLKNALDQLILKGEKKYA